MSSSSLSSSSSSAFKPIVYLQNAASTSSVSSSPAGEKEPDLQNGKARIRSAMTEKEFERRERKQASPEEKEQKERKKENKHKKYFNKRRRNQNDYIADQIKRGFDDYNAAKQAQELKAKAQEHPNPASYHTREDELIIEFKYKSKAEIGKFTEFALKTVQYLSYFGLMPEISEILERNGIQDLVQLSVLVGSVSYRPVYEVEKPARESRSTNLLDCDLLCDDPKLYEFEIEEFMPTKMELRSKFYEQMLGKRPALKEYDNRTVGYTRLIESHLGHIAPSLTVRSEAGIADIVAQYLSDDTDPDEEEKKVIDNLISIFIPFKNQHRLERVTISLALFYNLKQQFLDPCAKEATLLSSIFDVAKRWGAANIPIDTGNIAYETAVYTYWFILSKLSEDYRFTNVQLDRFVERLNVQSP